MVVEKDVVVSLRLTQKLKSMVDEAVKKSGFTTQEWLRLVLGRAATKGAFGRWTPPKKGESHAGSKKRKPA